MKNLAIIITGQLRTFFSDEVQNNFKQFILKCKQKYNFIYVLFIINDKFKDNEFYKYNDFFTYDIINYKCHLEEYKNTINSIYSNEIYKKNKTKYFSAYNDAFKEINNPDDYIFSHIYQFHQLQIGINKIIEYEHKNNVSFDTVIKSRFDLIYPNNFVPKIKKTNDFLKKLTYNDHNLKKFNDKLLKYNLKSFDEYTNFIKNQKIILPHCRIDLNMLDINFGGAYFYNKDIIEKNILHEPILYSYNDHFFFADKTTFLKLSDFFQNYGCIDTNINITHFFAPESQFIIYCKHLNINIIMFLNDSYRIYR